MGLETLHRLLQHFIGRQRPDQIFIVGDPSRQPWTEPALSQPINEIRQSQRCMYEKAVIKVRVTGNVQFKWITLHQLPVHDNAHPEVVLRGHNAYQQNPTFGRHPTASLGNGVPLPKTLRLDKNPGTQRRIIPLALKTIRNIRPSNVSP